MPPAGVFFSEIFMVFIVPIVPMVSIFLLKMAVIAMPWLAVSYEKAVRLLCQGAMMAILSRYDYVVIALR